MVIYFEFEDRKINADVQWPQDGGTITVHLTDKRVVKNLPADLLFELNDHNKIGYEIEDRDNKRLLDLQKVIARKLQELAKF